MLRAERPSRRVASGRVRVTEHGKTRGVGGAEMDGSLPLKTAWLKKEQVLMFGTQQVGYAVCFEGMPLVEHDSLSCQFKQGC